MKEIILPIEDIETLCAQIATTISGYNEDQVIVAYEQQGNPANGINDNFIYCYVLPVDDTISKYVNRYQEQIRTDEEVSYKRAIQNTDTFAVHFIIYGPDAGETARRMQLRWYATDVKTTLANKNLYTIPGAGSGITRVPEHYNGQWWNRYDLEYQIYSTTQVVYDIDTFKKLNLTMEEDI